MKQNQEIKFASACAFALAIVRGENSSKDFLPSKQKSRMLELANIIANTQESDISDDSVKVMAFFSLATDLNNAYKSASRVTVKDTNDKDKKFRVVYEKLVMRFGESRANEILAAKEESVNRLLQVAKRES